MQHWTSGVRATWGAARSAYASVGADIVLAQSGSAVVDFAGWCDDVAFVNVDASVVGVIVYLFKAAVAVALKGTISVDA